MSKHFRFYYVLGVYMISLEIAELMAQFIFRIFDCRNKCLCVTTDILQKKNICFKAVRE